jgi:DNA processing protein
MTHPPSLHTTPPLFLSHLLLSLLPGIGVHRYWLLVTHYGSANIVLSQDPANITCLNPRAKTLLADYQKAGENSALYLSAHNIIEQVQVHQGQMISVDDPLYPTLLKEIHHPPPLLYIKGNVDNLQLPQIAIVGSRHATHTGLKNTQLFSQHLSQHGFTITSGLALGIDHAAHQATLACAHTTIAVMATGIDTIYPKQHHRIAEEIITAGGTLVTEFSPNTPPKADHFPRRNRIICGLSMGVLVVEAAIKSGSLITAKYAIEQSREVFAIPSSIHNPHAKGCHQLIKQGAHLVETSQDIVDHLAGFIQRLQANINNDHNKPSAHAPSYSSPHITQTTSKNPLSPEETLVLSHIGFEPKSVDQLIQSSQLSSPVLSACLISLEINHYIKRSHWGYEQV